MDGTITIRTFDDAHLWNPELRALMQKIEVVENAEFTRAFKQLPQQHCTRVTVVTNSGERLVGESGGEQNDLAAQKSDAQIVEKFQELTEDFLGAKRVHAILDRLWHLDDLESVAVIPPDFVLG
jgi:2-methylcitrate dehydratase